MRATIVCRDALLHDGVSSILSSIPGLALVAGESGGDPVRAYGENGPVDILVVVLDGLEEAEWRQLATLRQRSTVRVVAIGSRGLERAKGTGVADVAVSRSSGSRGLRHAVNTILTHQAIQATQVREPRMGYSRHLELTQREREVAELISKGLSNRRIAQVLGIQEQSVKNIASVVLRKLGCENRVQVALHFSGRES